MVAVLNDTRASAQGVVLECGVSLIMCFGKIYISFLTSQAMLIVHSDCR